MSANELVSLADVYSAYESFEQGLMLFGGKADAVRAIREAFSQVGKALMEERGITDPEQAAKLDKETTFLGEKSLAAYQEFRRLAELDED